MKFPKSSFFGSAVNHSIFRNSVSCDQRVKMVKFHLFLVQLAPKVLLVFAICEISPSSTCHSYKYGVFAVSVLVPGKISLKSS